MADAKQYKGLKFILPRAPTVFPRLNDPDTKFKPEGEFSAKTRMKPKDFPKDILTKLEAMLAEFKAEKVAELKAKKEGAKAKTLKIAPILREETDKETGEATGYITVNAKMKHSGVAKKTGKPWKRWPNLFDAKGAKIRGTDGKALKAVPAIWGGTEGKVAVEAFPYYTPKDNEIGIAFKLEAFQLLKLVTGGGQSASDYGFGEEEDGYESEASEAGFKDEDGDSADAGDQPDF
jgi:hypothetical protein